VRVGDLISVQEPVEPANIALVADECLRGPIMGSVNHPHAFEHEEGIKGARGRQSGASIGTNRAQFAHKGVAFKGAGEEEALGEVSVAGTKGGSNPYTAEVVEIPTHRILRSIQKETRGGKKAMPNLAGPLGTTTAHTCKQPAK
jgi:hypothetical protein